MIPPAELPTACPKCGTPAAGTPADGWLFCARCGASLAASLCASCSAEIAAGAKFCHKCGAPTDGAARGGEPASRPKSAVLPWAVMAVALLALVALLAGRGFGRQPRVPPGASQAAMPLPGLDGESQMPVRASTDISQLSPQERADRLFNRVMLLSAEGKADSVRFFAPMAISAYEMLGDLNADQRYDLGRIAEAAGAHPLARAQADSILREQPSHLLGLVLAARMATLDRDDDARRRIEAQMLSVERAELARGLPEYQRHEADIMSALAQARRGSR